MVRLKIIRRTTHFEVVNPNKQFLKHVTEFNSNLITYKTMYMRHLRRVVKSLDRKYFYFDQEKKSYYYSINLLTTFIKRLTARGITSSDVDITTVEEYASGMLKAKINPIYTDREYQGLYIDKVLDTDPICLVDLGTGNGKTYISMRISTILKHPTGIMVLPRFIDKWISDVKEYTDVSDEDIFVVRGGKSLRSLLASDRQYDFVIMSLSTIRLYIVECDTNKDIVQPHNLFKKLGLGILLIDEVHMYFHAGYMATIRLNPLKVVALSATLDTLDVTLKGMYTTLYPSECRCGGLVNFKPFRVIQAINYTTNGVSPSTYSGTRGYSHSMFEQAIMRTPVFKVMYLEMVLHYIECKYMCRRLTGDKMLILVQTIKMATILVNYIRQNINKLIINRYVGEDPYSNIMLADICVSTNGSAGAALDLPRLITVLQTVSIGSLPQNVQAVGRLREIKDVDVMYCYIYSDEIDKHKRLNDIRYSVIRYLAKAYTSEEYQVRLPKLQ